MNKGSMFFINFVVAMKRSVIVGLTVLALVWIGLSIGVLYSAGFTLYNLIIIAFSGIIIFVPLWKKYFRNDNPK